MKGRSRHEVGPRSLNQNSQQPNGGPPSGAPRKRHVDRLLGRRSNGLGGGRRRQVRSSSHPPGRSFRRLLALLRRVRRHLGTPLLSASGQHSAASVVRVVRLRATRGAASDRSTPHAVPGRHLRHNPTEITQARRAGHRLGAPDQGSDRLRLPLSHRVRAGPSAARHLDRSAARPHRRLSRSPSAR
jgi:hypothetical protein